MTPRYTVWQWNQLNGWILQLGTDDARAADQVKRALARFAPQNWFQVFSEGRYSLDGRYEIRGRTSSARFAWGRAPDETAAWVVTLALSRILDAHVALSISPAIDLPASVRYELNARSVRAGV